MPHTVSPSFCAIKVKPPCRTTEGVVRMLVQQLIEAKKLVPARQAMCRISVIFFMSEVVPT